MDTRGPGLILLVPSIDRMVRISLRTITLTVPAQEIITRDNIPVRVTARRLLPGGRSEHGGDAGRELPQRDAADRADDAALGPRRRRLRRAALGARAAERGAPARDRRADRAVGDQGDDGRDQGRRDPRADAARDRPPGRGRARAARQDHQRRGRVPGRRQAGAGGGRDRPQSRRRSSCATSRRCERSAATRTPRSSFRCRSIW